MSAQQELRRAYEQWRALTESEGQAIRAAQWSQVAVCQAEKRLLQTQIKAAGTELQRELSATTNRVAIEREFDLIVDELLVREIENSKFLAGQRQQAEQQESQLYQACRQLRQIHQAYGTERHALWHSYS